MVKRENRITDDERKRSDENWKRFSAAWEHLTWWQQKKIFLKVLWFVKTCWIRQIPIYWVQHQLSKDIK